MKRMSTTCVFSTQLSVRGVDSILGLIFSSSLLNSIHMMKSVRFTVNVSWT